MSRIASKKTVKLDLGSGEWLEVRAALSFAELEPIVATMDAKNEAANIKLALPLFEAALVNWYLKDDDGNEVPFSVDKVKDLDAKTIMEHVVTLTTMYFPEKKS